MSEKNIKVFDNNSTQRILTPWGKAVKKSLVDNNLKQNDVIAHLQSLGIKINKSDFCNLLFGHGAGAREEIIIETSNFLNIPYECSA